MECDYVKTTCDKCECYADFYVTTLASDNSNLNACLVKDFSFCFNLTLYQISELQLSLSIKSSFVLQFGQFCLELYVRDQVYNHRRQM